MADDRDMEERIMKVKMPRKEFEKFDKGETHSDKGIRDNKGSISALPDILPISEDDLPKHIIKEPEIIYINQPKTSLGARASMAAKQTIYDVINNPEFQKAVHDLASALWHYKIKPGIHSIIRWFKDEKKFEVKALKAVEEVNACNESSLDMKALTEIHDKVTVSPEQAAMLVNMAVEESKKLSAVLYLLSEICIKDEKTDEEYILEKTFIKQLVSEESKQAMKQLIEQRKFLVDELKMLDNDTVTCYEDFLNGYLRCNNQRIPLELICKQTTNT